MNAFFHDDSIGSAKIGTTTLPRNAKSIHSLSLTKVVFNAATRDNQHPELDKMERRNPLTEATLRRF
jgi:hypothetical protein